MSGQPFVSIFGLAGPAGAAGAAGAAGGAMMPFFGGFDLWHPLNAIAAQQTSQGMVLNTLKAVPFMVGRNCTMSGVAWELTSLAGAGGQARFGLYNANQQTGEPSSLILDSGVIATDGATGIKSVTALALQLTAGVLYYAAINFGTSAAGGFRSSQATGLLITGHWLPAPAAAALTYAQGVSKASAFAALPDPFPAITGAGDFIFASTGAPMFAGKFSA